MLNSTAAPVPSVTPELSKPLNSYITPNRVAQQLVFKTPATTGSRSRQRIGGGLGSAKK